MKAIKIDIYYKGDLRKSKIFSMEEDYDQFMKWYGFDPENNKILVKKRNDKSNLEYFYPKVPIPGKEEDDKNLIIEMIIVDISWDM